MSEYSKYPKGSEWRKWDLHVHTPGTKLSDNYKVTQSDVWDTFCDIIQKSDVEVIGITDYFSTDNYFIFIDKFKKKYPDSNKVFFPNVEFRLEVSVNKKAEEVHIHVIFSNNTTKDKLDSFFSKLNTNINRNGACVSCSCLSTRDDFEIAAIDYKDIKGRLKEVFGNNECYLIFASSNNSGLRPDNNSPRKLNISDEIDKICDGFFGGNQNVNYYLKTDRYGNNEYAKQKPVISGCDAHSFDDLNNWLGKRFIRKCGDIDVIEKDITWLKSDPTFEGLKQIIYEPIERIKIQEIKPLSPVRKITSFNFNFPSNTMINVKDKSPDLFCLAGFNNTFYTSDYFTCFIGGRGTGKSTILSLIVKGLSPSTEIAFIDKNRITLNDEDINLSEFITIETSSEHIDFLEQSQIESFATDTIKFTQAIYSRLKGLDKSIVNKEKELQSEINKIDSQIDDYRQMKVLIEEINELENNLKSTKKVSETIETVEYKKITEELKGLNNSYLGIKNDRDKLQKLFNDFSKLFSNYNKYDLNEKSSIYQKSYNKFLNELKRLLDEISNDDNFKDEQKEEKELEIKITQKQSELEKYLEKQGLTEENLEDVKTSSIKIDEYENLKNEKVNQLSRLEKSASDFKITEIEKLKKEYDDTVKTNIDNLKKVLIAVNKENPDEIDKIDLSFDFNKELSKNNIFNDFYDEFLQYSEDFNTKKPSIQENLFSINPFEIIQEKKNLSALQKAVSGSYQYNKFLSNVFKNEINFKIYKLLIYKHLFNSTAYLKINVSYKDKPMEQASFGQKCTAVIVIMLLFGNNPIIIDEPEAHLDSSLIANYLVNLIKKEKYERQIIFATHNANFVVNSDAEQIFILEMPLKKTDFKQTTIENMDNRDYLLKLEGGKKAFIKRENKYGLANI